MRDSMAAILLASSSSKALDSYRMMQDARNEPIFEDLLNYFGVIGPLNLRLIAPEKWHKLA